ncbi:uncharacterized protein LOC143030772 [Oratosquilla oratoria]|uniref:uncharacterized protein LOC143030772 n=1 Tax=Oratosquilla oratoria TaxID=337810 RepID=UPI003F777757
MASKFPLKETIEERRTVNPQGRVLPGKRSASASLERRSSDPLERASLEKRRAISSEREQGDTLRRISSERRVYSSPEVGLTVCPRTKIGAFKRSASPSSGAESNPSSQRTNISTDGEESSSSSCSSASSSSGRSSSSSDSSESSSSEKSATPASWKRSRGSSDRRASSVSVKTVSPPPSRRTSVSSEKRATPSSVKNGSPSRRDTAPLQTGTSSSLKRIASAPSEGEAKASSVKRSAPGADLRENSSSLPTKPMSSSGKGPGDSIPKATSPLPPPPNRTENTTTERSASISSQRISRNFSERKTNSSLVKKKVPSSRRSSGSSGKGGPASEATGAPSPPNREGTTSERMVSISSQRTLRGSSKRRPSATPEKEPGGPTPEGRTTTPSPKKTNLPLEKRVSTTPKTRSSKDSSEKRESPSARRPSASSEKEPISSVSDRISPSQDRKENTTSDKRSCLSPKKISPKSFPEKKDNSSPVKRGASLERKTSGSISGKNSPPADKKDNATSDGKNSVQPKRTSQTRSSWKRSANSSLENRGSASSEKGTSDSASVGSNPSPEGKGRSTSERSAGASAQKRKRPLENSSSDKRQKSSGNSSDKKRKRSLGNSSDERANTSLEGPMTSTPLERRRKDTNGLQKKRGEVDPVPMKTDAKDEDPVAQSDEPVDPRAYGRLRTKVLNSSSSSTVRPEEYQKCIGELTPDRRLSGETLHLSVSDRLCSSENTSFQETSGEAGSSTGKRPWAPSKERDWYKTTQDKTSTICRSRRSSSQSINRGRNKYEDLRRGRSRSKDSCTDKDSPYLERRARGRGRGRGEDWNRYKTCECKPETKPRNIKERLGLKRKHSFSEEEDPRRRPGRELEVTGGCKNWSFKSPVHPKDTHRQFDQGIGKRNFTKKWFSPGSSRLEVTYKPSDLRDEREGGQERHRSHSPICARSARWSPALSEELHWRSGQNRNWKRAEDKMEGFRSRQQSWVSDKRSRVMSPKGYSHQGKTWCQEPWNTFGDNGQRGPHHFRGRGSRRGRGQWRQTQNTNRRNTGIFIWNYDYKNYMGINDGYKGSSNQHRCERYSGCDNRPYGVSYGGKRDLERPNKLAIWENGGPTTHEQIESQNRGFEDKNPTIEGAAHGGHRGLYGGDWNQNIRDPAGHLRYQKHLEETQTENDHWAQDVLAQGPLELSRISRHTDLENERATSSLLKAHLEDMSRKIQTLQAMIIRQDK